MRVRIAWVCLFGIALPLASQAATYRFSGTAEDMDGNRLYEEKHTVEGECRDGVFRPMQHQVDYVSLNRRLGAPEQTFASKTLDYGTSAIRPSVDFRQPAFDERMRIANQEDSEAAVTWQPPGNDTRTFEVSLSQQSVIDGGFVHFIQANWSALTKGQSVDFNFLAPTRGETYQFMAEPTDDASVSAALTLSMRPSTMLLRWLVDPIVLGFDEQGRLTDYVGLGNIRKNKEENYTVRLRYSPGETPCSLIR